MAPSSDLQGIVAAWLRDAIAREGTSVPIVAQRARLAKSTVYRLLKQTVNPEISTIARLQKALRTPFPALRADSPIKSDAAGAASPQARRSPRAAATPLSGASVVAEGGTAAQYVPQAGNTPGAIATGGEEIEPGSPAPLHEDEVRMALSVLQRALTAAVEHDNQAHDARGRAAASAMLKEFSTRLFELGLWTAAVDIARAAEMIGKGGFSG